MGSLSKYHQPLLRPPVKAIFCSGQTLPTTFRTPPECSSVWNVTTIFSTSTMFSFLSQTKYTPTEVFQDVISYRFKPYETGNSTNPTNTVVEHQSCLPLVTSSACLFNYVDAECPDGWKASSMGSASGTFTDYCCPKYVW